MWYLLGFAVFVLSLPFFQGFFAGLKEGDTLPRKPRFTVYFND